MAKNRKYTVKVKRKIQGKTDYKLRLSLLKSGKNRLVIRKSLKNILLQIVKSENSKDKIILSSHSRELRKFGWSYSLSNTPSSYLTGFLLGKKALKNNIKEGILDIGLQKSVINSRLYAALKGCIDAGLKIPHNPDIFPKEERIKGLHINKEIDKKFEEVKKKIENG
jgi:large subunit ribosomal protein L18